MRRIHSVVIALVGESRCTSHSLKRVLHLEVPDELRRPSNKESFMRMHALLRNQVANGVPRRCANQNECGAARGCGA
jgi:hypothetical protein